MFKKTLALFLTALFVLTVLPAAALAETSGGYEYAVNDSKATITGYTGSETELLIPGSLGGHPVTAIGNDAFAGNATVTKAVFPASVTVIGERAFSSCGALMEATLPAGIATIGEGAFLSCPAQFILYGYTGTAAEQYAAAKGLRFEPMHTVTFDSKGGSDVAKTAVQHGKKIAQPASPKRTGYAFAGWYKESTYATKWDFEKETVTQDMTLYAKWNYGEPGDSYKAEVSAKTVYSGKSLKFTLTTPKTVSSIKLYVDGKYQKKASLVKTSGDSRLWTLSVVFNKIGSRKAQFKAYSKSGTLKKTFPAQALKITVKPAPPATKKPIVPDCDRAVLLGMPPVQSGVKVKSCGFYFGTSADDLLIRVPSRQIVRGYINWLVTGLQPGTTYYYRVYAVTSKGTTEGSVVSFTTPAKKDWTAEGSIFKNAADKYQYLFGSTQKFYTRKSPPLGYVGSDEAAKNVKKVSVPCWKLENGKKVASHRTLYINYKLADSVKAIFKEIYGLDIKFPVITLSGYDYRRVSGKDPVTGKSLPYTDILSHHSFGAAIDMNEDYNDLYIGKDRRDRNSPYFIPQSVIDIFAKYGWAWGGNFKECKDTMHFQYLGLDLIGK
jgi:uncharacterized repeat protein (TIGR02543 family)